QLSIEHLVKDEQQDEQKQQDRPARPAAKRPEPRWILDRQQIPGEKCQRDGPRQVEVGSDLPGNESLAKRRTEMLAKNLLAYRHYDAGVKGESALPEHQGRQDQEAADEG